MRTIEVKHHSPEAVRGYIDEAERMLQDCGYDDDERVALLPTIVTLMSAKTVTLVNDAPAMLPAMTIPGRTRN